MPEQIKEIEGVWTAKEVQAIRAWMNGDEGVEKLKQSQEVAHEQSKAIKEIALVDMEKLKVPFTFTA